MASVTFDSEHMVHHLAAEAFPNTSHASTITDHRGNPLTFAIGNDKKFRMFQVKESGENALVDLSAKLGLDTSSQVHAFALSQSTDDFSTYLTVVTETAKVKTLVNCFKPIPHDAFDADDLSKYQMVHSVSDWERNGQIKEVRVSTPNTKGYPMVHIFLTDVKGVKNNQDIAQLEISDNKSFKIVQKMELPSNAQEILDLIPLNFLGMPGIATLYKNDGETCLAIVNVAPHGGYGHFPVQTSQGTTVIGSYVGEDGEDVLLTGGGNLSRFLADDIMDEIPGRTISTAAPFASAQRLFCAQNESKVAVWASDTAGSAGYITSSNWFGDGAGTGEAVIVLPAASGGKISPFVSSVTGRHEFIVLNDSGDVSLLHQDTQHTGLWRTVPYAVPVVDSVLEYQSYMVHCVVRGTDGKPLGNTEVILKTQGSIQVTIKGRPINLGPSGVSVTTDLQGIIDIIIGAYDLSTFTYSIEDVPGNHYLGGQKFDVDPSGKVFARLKALSTADGLKNAKLPNGKSLIPPGFDQTKLQNAADGVKATLDAREDLQKKNQAQSTKASSPQKFNFHHSQIFCGENTESLIKAIKANGLLQAAWETFYGLVEKAREWTGWAFGKLENGLHYLAIEFHGTVLGWVFEAMAQVLKGVAFILDKILEIFEDVLLLLGMIFEWDDIMATQATLSNYYNGAIDTVIDRARGAEDAVDTFFEGIKGQIRSLSPCTSDATLGTSASVASDIIGHRITNSVAANYVHYQLQHGGAANSNVESHKNSDGGILDFLDDILIPAAKNIEGDLKNLGADFLKLFKSKGTGVTAAQVLGAIGVDVLLLFVDVLETVVKGGVYFFVEVILNSVKEFLNLEMQIPIFSYLFEKATKSKLNMLNAITFFLAFPVTFGYKLCKGIGAKAPDLSKFDFGKLLDGKQDWDLDVDLLFGLVNVSSLGLIAVLQALDYVFTKLSSAEVELDGGIPRNDIASQAVRRFKHPSVLASQTPRSTPASNMSWYKFSPKNPLWRGVLFFGVRTVTLTIKIMDGEPSDIKAFDYSSWVLSVIVNATDVIAYGLLAHGQIADNDVIAGGLLVVSAIAELMVGVIDGYVLVRRYNHGDDDAGDLFLGLASSVAFVVSATCDAVAHVDPDPDTATDMEVLGLGTLVLACALTAGKVAYGHLRSKKVYYTRKVG